MNTAIKDASNATYQLEQPLLESQIANINKIDKTATVQMMKMMSLDSGMLVVLTIIIMYMTLVFILLFYVKNEWCDLLFKNMTV